MSEWSQGAAENLVLTVLYAMMNQGVGFIAPAELARALGTFPAPRVDMTLRTLERGNLVVGRHNALSGSSYQISDAGYKLIESAQNTLKLGPMSKDETGSLNNVKSIEEPVLGSYDSSLWTGLPRNFVLSEDKRERLVLALTDAENSLDALGCGNSEKAMARAYIVAARALADAPEPPVDLIWQIVGRANSVAGVASLFVSIIALFVVSAH